MHCPGSIEAEAGLPDVPSEFAAEGTLAHFVLLDRSLPFGIEPHYFIGMKRTIDGFDFEVTEEMADTLLPLYDEITDIKGQHHYEINVDLSKWLPDQSGTADIAILTREMLIIRDLKYGQGIPVSPLANEQLLIYALGVCAWLNSQGIKIGNRKIRLQIDQPRCPGGGGIWDIDLEFLLDFGEKVRKAGRAALAKNAPRKPGAKTCMWCKAKDTCEALAKFNLAMAQMTFDDLDSDNPELPKPETLSPKTRAKILKHQSLITNWLASLHLATLEDALAGKPAGGFKAVLGRSPARTWDDEEEAKTLMQKAKIDWHEPPKLRSPAQVETAIKEKIKGRTKAAREQRAEALAKFEEHVIVGIPKPILVPEEDARPRFFAADNLFEDLNE